MARDCVTHHHACDCREEKFRKIEAALRAVVDGLPAALEDAREVDVTRLDAIMRQARKALKGGGNG